MRSAFILHSFFTMKLYSLNFYNQNFYTTEISMMAIPGLPQIHLIGDVHLNLKEVTARLKSAVISLGFQWPRTKQLVIEFKTEHGSAGRETELAILIGILTLSEQIEPLSLKLDDRILGQIGVDGQIELPPWTELLPDELRKQVHSDVQWTQKEDGSKAGFEPTMNRRAIEQLNLPSWERPEASSLILHPTVARLTAILAHGEHNALFAGPPGLGKTTVAHAIYQCLSEPRTEEARLIQLTHALLGETSAWRPFIAPHHSSTSLSLIGGGVPPAHGEISRAHGGILFLDEYLEFTPKVQEALREPLERGTIRISRGSKSRIFPADFQLLAATNLCPCGKLAVFQRPACPLSLTRCRSHYDRLSGPMLDRFQVISLCETWRGQRTVDLKTVQEQVQQARAFMMKRHQTVPNQKLSESQLKLSLAEPDLAGLPPWEGSERRKLSLLKVARSIADLEKRDQVSIHHLSEAYELTVVPFFKMTHLFA